MKSVFGTKSLDEVLQSSSTSCTLQSVSDVDTWWNLNVSRETDRLGETSFSLSSSAKSFASKVAVGSSQVAERMRYYLNQAG